MSILMTVEELAKYLRIKPDTIYKKVRKGELPAIKLGKIVRFPKELIDEWIVDQATKTMNDIKLAKKLVEKKIGQAVGRVEDVVETVEDAVEQAMESAKEHAEQAVTDVKKTQHELSKNIKGLWKDLQNTLASGSKTVAKKVSKSVPIKAKTTKKVTKAKHTTGNGKTKRVVASRRKSSASASVN